MHGVSECLRALNVDMLKRLIKSPFTKSLVMIALVIMIAMSQGRKISATPPDSTMPYGAGSALNVPDAVPAQADTPGSAVEQSSNDYSRVALEELILSVGAGFPR